MELKHIGRYDIKSLIGQGGMSAVYLGYDPRSQREVAVKILPPYYLHAPKFRERFDREALTIALLEHPAIVPIYDMGEDDGQPYIVMRYMSGGSLADKLKNGPIPLKECAEMYLRLAPALDNAHARGIIHRDIKPDNLLYDKYNNVFLSDFGLARLRETIGIASISDGSILGTPAYMSPEQIQGDREIDGRSDIYSMGVMLYHMCSGSVPFNGSTAASVMMMHLINPVPQVIDQNRSLPAGIQAILETAMAKNPADRYQTVGEFARAIQTLGTESHRRRPIHDSASPLNKPPNKPATFIFPSGKPALSPNQGTDALAVPVAKNTLGTSTASGRTADRPRRGDNLPVHEVTTRPTTSIPVLGSQPERRPIPQWVWVPSIALVVFLSILLFQWFRGGFPFSLLPGASLTPQITSSSVSPGQADKLAFLQESDIWVSNLDGTGLVQLTSDGLGKSSLHWSPDGKSIIYSSGSCLNSVDLAASQPHTLTCFSTLPVTSFDISPSGNDVALGLGRTDLYLLPYTQLFNLRPKSAPQDLLALSQCSYYSPYHMENTLKSVTWSSTGKQLALLVAVSSDGTSRDEIRVLDFSTCSQSPELVQEIPSSVLLFTLRGYFSHPEISGISWKDHNQLMINGYLGDAGFGDLQLYDLYEDRSQPIAPNGSCCYRDASWSPDGTYLFYAHQPEAGGETSLFYIPYSASNEPVGEVSALVLPSGFLTKNPGSLQPALRTTH